MILRFIFSYQIFKLYNHEIMNIQYKILYYYNNNTLLYTKSEIKNNSNNN
jgi:hypothetical protein